MTHDKYNELNHSIPEEKIDKLTKKIAKSLVLDNDIAWSLIYKEWETVENLFEKHKKVKAVHQHLLKKINGEYHVCDPER